jgi:hypothetical protein
LDILGLQSNILPKINLKMIGQGGLVDILMVIGFAHKVENSLDDKVEEQEEAQQEEANYSHSNSDSQWLVQNHKNLV